jgi:hypothetical protein
MPAKALQSGQHVALLSIFTTYRPAAHQAQTQVTSEPLRRTLRLVKTLAGLDKA